MTKNILISGASIAGPALAFWLVRAGHKVVIVERGPALRVGGNGVDVRGQAVEVIERMGLTAHVRAKRIVGKGMRFVDAKGRKIASIELKAMQKESEAEILRGDLARILHEATKDAVDYAFGDSITALAQTADGVDVSFERGAARTFDLVIGADGTHSNVRRLAFGPEDRYLHFLQHYAAFARADEGLGEPGWFSLFNVPGKMAGIDRVGSTPKASFAFRSEKPLAYDYRDLAAQKRLLAEAFTGLPWHTQQLVDGAVADPDFYFDSLSQVRMPSWSSGRVALVGDAAYCASPVSGAGAMLSLVGAYRLGGELASADYALAFRNYEEGFRKTVERTQSSLFIGLLAPRTCGGIFARNLMARSPLLGAMAGLEQRFQPRLEPLPAYGREPNANAA